MADEYFYTVEANAFKSNQWLWIIQYVRKRFEMDRFKLEKSANDFVSSLNPNIEEKIQIPKVVRGFTGCSFSKYQPEIMSFKIKRGLTLALELFKAIKEKIWV